MKKDPFDLTQFAHELDPMDFQGRAALALDSLSSGSWKTCGIREITYAFDTLYDRHSRFAGLSEAGVEDKRCVQIRKCIHILARVWARKWLARGEAVFLEKKEYYRRKSRAERETAHDEVLYSALISVFRSEFGESSKQ
jgi:hypothetical protein